MKINEEWRIIEEAPNYEVSNYGEVRNIRTRKSLKPGRLKSGYLKVSLGVGTSQPLQRYIHRLVATAFLSNENNFPQVNHKDEDKGNNFVGTAINNYQDGNLEWCSAQYNVNYGTLQERRHKMFVEKLKNCELNTATVIYVYDKDTKEFIGKFGSIREAARQLDCDMSVICKILSSKYSNKSCHGFIFFKEEQYFDKSE